MTFSYNPNLTDDKDVVRLLIGDRVDAGHQFEDEEIYAMLGRYPDDVYEVSIQLVDSLIAKYAGRSGTTSIGPFTVSYSELINQYRMIRDRLEILQQTQSVTAGPWYSAATDRGPFAAVGMHDYYRSSMENLGDSIPWWGTWY